MASFSQRKPRASLIEKSLTFQSDFISSILFYLSFSLIYYLRTRSANKYRIYNMFRGSLGSPRFQTQQDDPDASILSPRNFLKLISNSIDEFRKPQSPSQANYEQFLTTFHPYLTSFEQQYQNYQQRKKKAESNTRRNDQLQLELKINRIPSMYFSPQDEFKLVICKRGEATRKQEELTDYLDEIEVVLFTKAGKYPQKSNIILQNMSQLETDVDASLLKVIDFRSTLKEKLIKISDKQRKVQQLNIKLARVKKTIQNVDILKKMRDLKQMSSSQYQGRMLMDEQMFLRIKKSQIQIGNRFSSLHKIMSNIEKYRRNVKEKLYQQFNGDLEHILLKLLSYNKDEWKHIHIPQSIFMEQNNNHNDSNNNITILNESYFAFDTNNVQVMRQNNPIMEVSEDDGDVIDLSKICKLWTVIKQYELYDQAQLNQNLTRILVKHSTTFSSDMHEYVNFLFKEKQREGAIQKVGQSYATLKNKQQTTSNIQEVSSSSEWSEEKLSSVDMKLYLKVVKFYFELLKKVLQLINGHRELQFFTNFKPKLADFIEHRISHFIEIKKASHQMKMDDFFCLLEILNYWPNEDFYQIDEYCQNLRLTKIEQYLTNIQTHLLTKDIRENIEQSKYLPVNLSSQNYMIFQCLLSSGQEDEANMSMTINCQPIRMEKEKEGEDTLRLINKNIYFKNKIYKICDSFLSFIKQIERYVRMRENLPDFSQNIEERICEIIGFYAWYNQKNLNNTKNGAKTLKNYCTFFSTLLFLKEIMNSLNIINKKLDKTRNQLAECQAQISKTITLTPYMMIEDKISQIYDSRISTRNQIPTVESQKIIEILKISVDCLKEYFPIENESKLVESPIFKFLQTTIKLIYKNYFGYLANMEKRGIAEIKWFLPRVKEILEITLISNKMITNKKGELLCNKDNSTFYLFNEEIEDMEKLLKQKSTIK